MNTPYRGALPKGVDAHFTVVEPAFDDSWLVRAGSLRIHRHGAAGAYYWKGDFTDPPGLGSLYRQHDHTRLDFIHDGRCYARAWQRYFGDRTISRLTRAFVTDIIADSRLNGGAA